jgi:hypothetical protein
VLIVPELGSQIDVNDGDDDKAGGKDKDLGLKLLLPSMIHNVLTTTISPPATFKPF